MPRKKKLNVKRFLSKELELLSSQNIDPEDPVYKQKVNESAEQLNIYNQIMKNAQKCFPNMNAKLDDKRIVASEILLSLMKFSICFAKRIVVGVYLDFVFVVPYIHLYICSNYASIESY